MLTDANTRDDRVCCASVHAENKENFHTDTFNILCYHKNNF